MVQRRAVLAGLPFAVLLAAAAAPAQPPLDARPTASAESELAARPPIPVEFAAGEAEKTTPAEVDRDHPATFLLAVPARVALTIGVSSKSGAARLSIYEEGATKALPATEPESGCVRWIGQATRPGGLRVVVHTQGEPTPVRLEVRLDRDLDFNSPSD